MRRSSERLIDVLVLAMLLVFGYLMRSEQPALAGVITAAAVQFWLQKNATAPTEPSIVEAAAKAAADILKTAEKKAVMESKPKDVVITGQSDTVEVEVKEKT